jgi:hypothetical protein
MKLRKLNQIERAYLIGLFSVLCNASTPFAFWANESISTKVLVAQVIANAFGAVLAWLIKPPWVNGNGNGNHTLPPIFDSKEDLPK